jgi:2,3-bisphosphoglycerate-dependent phosphoglycerate mutase
VTNEPPESSSAAAPSPAHRQVRWVAPAGSTEILLVRHGATIGVADGETFPLKDGHGDPSLAPEGYAQAKLVAARLAKEDISALYVTPLIRTHQTAAPIEAALGLSARVESDLREVFLGDWEGGEFRRRAAAQDPRFVRAMEEDEWGFIPGGETTQQLTDRCMAVMARLCEEHRDQRVVAVVHGGVISAILGCATNTRHIFHGPDNCSISHVVFDGSGGTDVTKSAHGSKWILRCFNDTAHLGGFSPTTFLG